MKILLIDGLNLIRRVYAGVPGDQSLPEHTNAAVVSCGASLGRALRFHQPTHVVCIMEDSGQSWRHNEFPAYKKNRSPMPETLYQALAKFEQAFADQGVKCISIAGFEADDVIATLATGIANHQGQVVVLSTDKSLCQLVSNAISVYDHFAARFLDEEYIQQRFGVAAKNLPVLFALVGDTSLSVPGVKGIGVRTGAKLLTDYANLEQIFEAAEEMKGNIGAKLRAGRDAAYQAKNLLTLRTDVEVGINLKELRWEDQTTGQN